jgi:hypothetical protein
VRENRAKQGKYEEIVLKADQTDPSPMVRARKNVTPEVYRVFTELWQERRLDMQGVFLYKGLPIRDVKTAFDKVYAPTIQHRGA